MNHFIAIMWVYIHLQTPHDPVKSKWYGKQMVYYLAGYLYLDQYCHYGQYLWTLCTRFLDVGKIEPTEIGTMAKVEREQELRGKKSCQSFARVHNSAQTVAKTQDRLWGKQSIKEALSFHLECVFISSSYFLGLLSHSGQLSLWRQYWLSEPYQVEPDWLSKPLENKTAVPYMSARWMEHVGRPFRAVRGKTVCHGGEKRV